MPELKNAYEILELDEGVSKEDIEKRYNLLIKRYKNREISDISTGITLEEVTEAYQKLISQFEVDHNKNEVPVNPTLKKINHYIYYYKFQAIAIVIILSVVGHLAYTIATRVDPDLRMAFLGKFYGSNTGVKESIQGKLDNVKAVSVDVMYLTDKLQNQQDIAMMQKASTLLMSQAVDAYIVDKYFFEIYAKNGGFVNLDSFVKEFNIEPSRCYKAKSEEDDTEHVYGIDVGKSKLIKGSGIEGVEGAQFIASIRIGAKYEENAFKLLKMLINE